MFSLFRKRPRSDTSQPEAVNGSAPVSLNASVPPQSEPQDNATEPLEVRATVWSDVGCVRQSNEDSGRSVRPDDTVAVARQGVLTIVADGMGGHAAGEVASAMTVDIVAREYYAANVEPTAALKHAVEAANRAIYQEAQRDKSKRGMGTTCTALLVRGQEAFHAHVGDSRLYLIREGGIYLMSEDHSAVGEFVRRGLIRPEEARHHPQKNVILRALGTQPSVEVALWDEPFPIREGDAWLICSDGLYDLVEDGEILEAVLSRDADGACQRLIELAKERGGHDNITVAIVEIGPERNHDDTAPVESAMPETREVARPQM